MADDTAALKLYARVLSLSRAEAAALAGPGGGGPAALATALMDGSGGGPQCNAAAARLIAAALRHTLQSLATTAEQDEQLLRARVARAAAPAEDAAADDAVHLELCIRYRLGVKRLLAALLAEWDVHSDKRASALV